MSFGARGLVAAFCLISPLGRIAVIRMAPSLFGGEPALQNPLSYSYSLSFDSKGIHFCQTILTNAAVTDSTDIDYRDLTLSLQLIIEFCRYEH